VKVHDAARASAFPSSLISIPTPQPAACLDVFIDYIARPKRPEITRGKSFDPPLS